MTEEEKRFFRKMREDVKNLILLFGLEMIAGWKVTEKGVTAILKNEFYKKVT